MRSLSDYKYWKFHFDCLNASSFRSEKTYGESIWPPPHPLDVRGLRIFSWRLTHPHMASLSLSTYGLVCMYLLNKQLTLQTVTGIITTERITRHRSAAVDQTRLVHRLRVWRQTQMKAVAKLCNWIEFQSLGHRYLLNVCFRYVTVLKAWSTD